MTGTATDATTLPILHDQPRDRDRLVFREPWEAQAFAMAVKLHEVGHFTWSEWAGYLGAEIRSAQARGDPDLGDTYYGHWLAALERIVVEKGLLADQSLADRKIAWARAYRDTPHGRPVELPDADGPRRD